MPVAMKIALGTTPLRLGSQAVLRGGLYPNIAFLHVTAWHPSSIMAARYVGLSPFRSRASHHALAPGLRACACVNGRSAIEQHGELRHLSTTPSINSQTAPEGWSQVQTPNNRLDTLLEQYDRLKSSGEAEPESIADLIKMIFPYDLDAFQEKALYSLASQSSVVLSAPTGAGKTVVGEMAIYLALCRRLRVFYTTPLKALSNQKFYDFKRQFGEGRVGLLTGDITVNREADIIVMTTEIYRNMLYADATENRAGPPVTDNLFAVVFDEFHYLNDRDRGTVWEESVINSPEHVLLVALSATMSNTDDVRDWFRSVQGPTTLVESSIRPVPLKFGYCDNEGLLPLFEEQMKKKSDKYGKGFGRSKKSGKDSDSSKPKMHPKLLRRLREEKAREKDRRKFRELAQSTSEDGSNDDIARMKKKFGEVLQKGKRRQGGPQIPSFPFVIRSLRKQGMLPCIVFIFSRAGCDRAAFAAASERDELVTPVEQAQILARVEAFAADNPDMVQPERLRLAVKGVASHHAGLLPLWKLCIEELFQDGLIKVVFATETLAAGINMPARTTAISSLSKRAGEEGFQRLTTSEVLQMAGRAGRRGKDILGYSVVLRSRREGAFDAFKILTASVDALESKFSPTYGMVLNLLLTRSLEDAKKLVDRSFGNFLRQNEYREGGRGDVDEDGQTNIQGLRREREALESILEESRSIVSSVEEAGLKSVLQALERVKAEKRALGYLVEQSAGMSAALIEDTLAFAPAGTKLLLRERRSRVSSGAEKRQKRRDYAAAISAAADGDLGDELRAFYHSGSDQEMEELLEDDDTSPQTAEAVLLDMHSESMGPLSVFAGVDANGKLRLFNHTAVVRVVYEEETLNVADLCPDWAELVLPSRSKWRSVSYDQFEAPLPGVVAPLVDAVQQWRAERVGAGELGSSEGPEKTSDEVPWEVAAQENRVRVAKRALADHPLSSREDLPVVLAAKRAISKIEGTLSGEIDPFGTNRRKRRRGRHKEGRYAVLGSVDAEDTSEGEAQAAESEPYNDNWDEFLSLTRVLQHYGYIDELHKVTSLGELGAKLKSENELWTSLVLLEPELADVSPMHLGAILGAAQMESARGDAFVEQEVSQEVRECVAKLGALRLRLLGVQSEFGIESSVPLEAELMGLVEMWATGMSWVDLLRGTSLQEGDVVRVLRRTLDVLRQIRHLPLVSDGLKRNARRSIALLDRFPITDDRTYTVGEDEKADVFQVE